MSNKFDLSVVADSIPFSAATYSSTNLKDAVVEAGLKPSSGGSPTIQELTSDPVSPIAGETWVLRQSVGTPIGLLLSLTTDTGLTTYKLSYKTISGAIVRTSLT